MMCKSTTAAAGAGACPEPWMPFRGSSLKMSGSLEAVSFGGFGPIGAVSGPLEAASSGQMWPPPTTTTTMTMGPDALHSSLHVCRGCLGSGPEAVLDGALQGAVFDGALLGPVLNGAR